MKIIHCADLHLDSKMETLPSAKGKIRREEVLHTFERLADYAEKNGVKAVIIAGDMIDTHKVSQRTRGRILSAVKNAGSVDFLYLPGNHDDENFITGGEGAEPLPENLKTFSDEWTYFDYKEAVIAGVALTPVNSRYVYDALKLDEKRLNIVTLHGQAAGYKSAEKAELISLPMLKDKNIDYLALGHIHSYAEGPLGERGVYAYSGCLDGRGFDETGEKGFVLLSAEGGRLSREFVPFASRTLYEAELDVSAYPDWYSARDALFKEVLSSYPETSLVKAVLKGEHPVSMEIDMEELAARLNERFFFGKAYDNTSLKVSEEDYAADKSVRGEFVRLVLAAGLPKAEADKIILTGINALKGEDI